MKRILQGIAILVVAVLAARYGEVPGTTTSVDEAFEARLSDQMMVVEGQVTKVLADDNHGSRHQRFIVRVPSGRTVLIAHNIDLAPRVKGLREGDSVRMYGEYEWNERGGVLHWTHHAPRGDHADGWIEHNGERYQ